MHKKCIIIDEELILLGSTNITSTSLKLHSNLILLCKNQNLAKNLIQNKDFKALDFELLSTENNSDRIQELIIEGIRSASKCIHLAMFTFTHKRLLQELILAHKRGITLKIYLDKMQSKGCSKQVLKALQEHKIQVIHNKSRPLLHHKLCLIDESLLITGSLNWTQAAFKKNKELVLVINNINPKQKKTLHEILKLLDK